MNRRSALRLVSQENIEGFDAYSKSINPCSPIYAGVGAAAQKLVGNFDTGEAVAPDHLVNNVLPAETGQQRRLIDVG